ncbi:MAG: hypothetical protein ACQEP3_02135 [Patescibacteria group bacterium]
MTQKIYDIKPPEKVKKNKNRNQNNNQGKSRKFAGGLLAGIFLVLAIVFFFSFRVEIDIWPTTEGLELEEEITVDITSDSLNGVLPGTIFETDFLEEYREFEATGVEDDETKATGTVVVQNTHWSQNQPLVEGTRFESEDGKIFKSKDGFIVPGGSEDNPGEVEVEVEADDVGSSYNIDPANFTLPGLEGSPSYEGVTAASEERMTGGAVGERTVISEEDIENAREEIINSLMEEGKSILKEGKGENYLLESDSQFTYEIEEEEVSGKVGEAAENFSVEIRARIDALTFEREDFNNLLLDALLDEVESSKENGLEGEKKVYEDSLSYNYEFLSVDWEEGKGELNVELAGEVYSDINESRLLENAQGSPRDSIKAVLEEKDFVREAEVKFKPFGIGSIPENTERIKINLNF